MSVCSVSRALGSRAGTSDHAFFHQSPPPPTYTHFSFALNHPIAHIDYAGTCWAVLAFFKDVAVCTRFLRVWPDWSCSVTLTFTSSHPVPSFPISLLVWPLHATFSSSCAPVALYAISAVYFAGVMVRLMLTLTPVVCMLSAVAFSSVFEHYMGDDTKREKPPAEDSSDEDDKRNSGNLYDKVSTESLSFYMFIRKYSKHSEGDNWKYKSQHSLLRWFVTHFF